MLFPHMHGRAVLVLASGSCHISQVGLRTLFVVLINRRKVALLLTSLLVSSTHGRAALRKLISQVIALAIFFAGQMGLVGHRLSLGLGLHKLVRC